MLLADTSRPTWADINLEHLEYNFNSCRAFIGHQVKVMAVVKADAYGHGAVPCALALERCGVDWFGVALVEEGIELRKAGIIKPVLCLGGFWPGQEATLMDHNLTPVVFRREQADSLDRVAAKRSVTVPIHVKIDTGMGRLGVRWDKTAEFTDSLKGFNNLNVEGLMTHFAAADQPDEDAFTRLQISRFDECLKHFKKSGFDPEFVDMANSPASVAYPDSRRNLVRLGGILYGLGDDVLPPGIDKPELKPVLSLYSRIGLIKEVAAGESIGYSRTFRTERVSHIATIPIGYHDGYRRVFSNKANVIVNGRLAPVVGRVSMDWTILDVTDIPEVRVGDVVTLIGSNGSLEITAGELAGIADSISYEITCGVGGRVPRKYINAR